MATQSKLIKWAELTDCQKQANIECWGIQKGHPLGLKLNDLAHSGIWDSRVKGLGITGWMSIMVSAMKHRSYTTFCSPFGLWTSRIGVSQVLLHDLKSPCDFKFSIILLNLVSFLHLSYFEGERWGVILKMNQLVGQLLLKQYFPGLSKPIDQYLFQWSKGTRISLESWGL